MVRVLQELPSLDGGGVAKIVYEYYRHMDRTKVKFDFIIYDYYEQGVYEDAVKKTGSKIYKLTAYQKDKKKCLNELEQVFRTTDYDVFHSHIGYQSFFSLRLAKKYGIPCRYVHSHISVNNAKSLRNKCSIAFQNYVSAKCATQLFACGRDAAISRWGKKAWQSGKVKIMTNAIEIEDFAYSNDKNIKIRKELGIDTDKFVIGIVGRLEQQKNYPFLFEVYAKVLERRKDAILLVIGRGPDEDDLKEYAKSIGVFDRIIFTGIRTDVPDLMSAMDVFALPSLYEGLPIVLVEAQASGLPELVSDRVTDEINVTGLIDYLPIHNTQDEWAEKLISMNCDSTERIHFSEKVASAGYSIELAAKKMEEFYTQG